jgi:hypothetical protein
MFDWLYSIFVSIVSFVLSLFGLSLDKRTVELMDNKKEEPSAVPEVSQASHAEHTAQSLESAQLP